MPTVFWHDHGNWEVSAADRASGAYVIERCCFDGENPWFAVTYCNTEGDRLIGTANSRDGAWTIADEHLSRRQ